MARKCLGRKGLSLTAKLLLEGQEFIVLNRGSQFVFSQAISFVVNCETQEEIDRYWEQLSNCGEQQPCGWLKDKYGVSWQVVPVVLAELLNDPSPEKSQRVMKALLPMGKIDIHELERASAND